MEEEEGFGISGSDEDAEWKEEEVEGKVIVVGQGRNHGSWESWRELKHPRLKITKRNWKNPNESLDWRRNSIYMKNINLIQKTPSMLHASNYFHKHTIHTSIHTRPIHTNALCQSHPHKKMYTIKL